MQPELLDWARDKGCGRVAVFVPGTNEGSGQEAAYTSGAKGEAAGRLPYPKQKKQGSVACYVHKLPNWRANR